MKQPHRPLVKSPFPRLIALSLGLLAASLSPIGTHNAMASSDTWTGAASTENWADANWTGADNPPLSNDSLFFSGTSAEGTSLNDNLMTPATFNVAGITFLSGTETYTINPNTPGTNGFTLTGAITNSSTNIQTINDLITLGATETLNAASGNITLGGVISDGGHGYGITLTGANTVTLSAANSYTGATTVNNGTLAFSGAGSSSSSAIAVGQTVGSVLFAGVTVTPTAAGTTTLGSSLTWNGECVTTSGVDNKNNFTVNGVAAGNTVEQFGALTLNPGLMEGNIVPNAASNTQVVFSSVTRSPGSIFYFGRSDNNTAQVLGQTTLASGSAGYANIVFTAAPALSGNGGAAGTTSVSILPWASAKDGVPATYDSTYGLRPLSSSEMATLTFGGMSLGTGSAGQNATSTSGTFTTNTTVNSLSGGGTIGLGGNTLTVSSGFIDTTSVTIGSSVNDGTLALGSEGIILVENQTNSTINSVISGTSGLTIDFNDVTGNGAYLVLAGSNTFSGATTIMGNRFNDMSLRLTNSLALQNSTLNYNEYGAQLRFGNGASTGQTAYTFGGLIGAQNITLMNNNTTAQAVALTVGGDNDASDVYSGVLSDGTAAGGSLIKTGTGTLTLTGANTYTGTTTISGGTLQLGNGGTTGSLSTSGSISDNSALVFDRSNTPAEGTDFPNNIGGTGSVTQAGTGTLFLTSSNSFSGGVKVNAGAISVNTTYGFGPVSNTITLGNSSGAAATLVINGTSGSNASNLDQPVTVSGAGTNTISGTWTNSGQINLLRGAITLNSENLTINSTNASGWRIEGGVTGTGNLTLQANNSSGNGISLFNSNSLGGTTEINNTGTVTNSGTGTGNLTTNTGGTNPFFGPNVTSLIESSTTSQFQISNSNTTFAGTAQVLAGTMALSNATALNSNNAVSVASGATLDIQNVSETIAGLNNVSGSGGTVTDSTGSAVRTLTLGGTGSYTFGGVITAATPADMALTVNLTSGGSQILSGSNTYSGGTTINGGTLQAANASALGSPAGSLAVNTGTLDMDGNSLAVGPLSGSTANGVITSSAAGTLTLTSSSSGNTSFAGSIQNGSATSIALIKSGTGALTLSGSSSYSGGTTINNGTIIQTATGALGSGAITLGDGSTSNSATLEEGSSSASLTNSNAITVAAGGSGTYTIEDTTSHDYTFSGNVALNNALILMPTSSGAIFMGGTITGSSQITVSGNSSSTKFVNFSANSASTYTGNVLVTNSGDFKLGNASAFGSSTEVTMDHTATLDMGGNAETFAGLEDQSLGAGGSTVLDNGGGLTLGGTGSYSFSGNIQSGGPLTMSGAGSQTLAGSNTYAGTTTVTSGTLIVSGSLNGTSSVRIGSGGTLAGTGTIFIPNASALTGSNGSFLAPGLSANGLTLSSTSTAALSLQAGSTLELSMSNSQSGTPGAPALTDYSKLTLGTGVSGTLAGAISTTVNGTINPGDLFTVILSGAAVSGMFSNADTTQVGTDTYSFTSNGQQWLINYDYDTSLGVTGFGQSASAFEAITGGTDVALLAVPEPGTWAMMLSGTGMLIAVQRMRRRKV